jgi:asparagine synthase (glutamine-hydrolysing)
MGFGVPLTHWFRGQLKDYLREVLLSEKAQQRGLIKSEVVARMVSEHTSGERDHVSQLWTLLMLELWFQRFID